MIFFQENVLKFVHAELFPLLKARHTPLSNSESVKATKNVIDF